MASLKHMSDTNERPDVIVGLEVSSTRILAVGVGRDDQIIERIETDRAVRGEAAGQVVEFANEAAKRFGVSRVGIAVPGLVSRETGNVAFSAAMPENVAVDFAAAIREANVEALVENDANAAGYAEFKIGAGRGSRNMFYATIGEGVGGSMILDGKVWHGAAGYAGEFGFIAINSDGMRLEDVASSANLVRRTRSRFNRDSTSSLSGLSEDQIRLQDIVKAADLGDDFAKLMLERTGMYIGTAIASVINLMNVERIVVGGEITHARHLVIDSIVNRARELSFTPSFESTRILAGELDDAAGAVGAAFLANGL
jgi:glucokinase